MTAQPNEHAMHGTIINKDSSAQDLHKMNLVPSITPRFTHYSNLSTILNQQFKFHQSATVEFKLDLRFELVCDILC